MISTTMTSLLQSVPVYEALSEFLRADIMPRCIVKPSHTLLHSHMQQYKHGWLPAQLSTWVKNITVTQLESCPKFWKHTFTHVCKTKNNTLKVCALTRFASSFAAQEGQFDVIHCCRLRPLSVVLLCVQVTRQSPGTTLNSALWWHAFSFPSLSLSLTFFLLLSQTLLSSISPPTTQSAEPPQGHCSTTDGIPFES